MKSKLTTEQKLEMAKVLINHDLKQLVYKPHCKDCAIARKMGTVIYHSCMKRSTAG